MKITASVFGLYYVAHRLCVPTGIKLSRECAITNILKGRRRAVPQGERWSDGALQSPLGEDRQSSQTDKQSQPDWE